MDHVWLLWLLSVLLFDSSQCTQRTLRSWVNPDCGKLCDDRNITTLYLRADGPNDTLHYLWDFGGDPSVLLALTPPSVSLNITWEDFITRKANSVIFSEQPIYTFGVMVNRIIEFNDVNDTGLINTASPGNINSLRPRHFQWIRKTVLQNEEFIALEMEGSNYKDTEQDISRSGRMKISLRGFCTLDHSQIVPHMLHTENSTQVDIILDHLETNKTFSSSRFAIELLIVGTGDPSIPVFVDPKKSLDDEHTPGIFEVVEVRLPPYENLEEYQNGGAYLQWRPVSYTSTDRDVTNSTETAQYPPIRVANRTEAVKDSMLYCFYGQTVNDLLLQKVTVSMGANGDGFYKKTKYSTWTFLIGYGTPPDEQFSSLVIMIIAIGLGLPMVILLGTGLYFCIYKIPRRSGEAYLSTQ